MTSIVNILDLVKSVNLLKEKVHSSVALSENVYYLGRTVDNDLIAMKALNTEARLFCLLCPTDVQR